MSAIAIPLAALGVALVVFVADLLLGPAEKRGLGALTCAALAGVLALTWKAPLGEAFGGAYVEDGFALFLQRVFLGAAALAALGSIDHADRVLPRRQGEWYLMLLSSLAGMLFLAGARELVLLVVAFELMGVPLYVLAAMHKSGKEGAEGALKLYLTGAVSSAVLLYGLSFVVGATGSTSLAALASAEPTPLLALGILLALAGMGFKVGAVPFHMWVPDCYQAAPTPFVAFLSVAPKAAGFAAMVRLFIEGGNGLRTTWWPVLLVVCATTMIAGNVLALPQSNVKRLLAYSGIAHIGLMLLAFGIATVEGIGMLLFYLAAYLFTNMGAFLVAEVVGRGGNDDLSAYRGLARRSPALALAMLLFLLSLGGVPFVAGFWAKFLLFWAAWDAGMGGMVLLGAILAVVGLFYYLRVARSIYLEAPDPDAATVEIGRPTAFAIAVAVAGVVGIGLVPAPFVEAALAAARSVGGGG